MDINHFFNWIGERLGAAIRAIVDGLAWLFGHLFGVIDSFLDGLTSSLGISGSALGIALLVIGLLFLLAALRALLRARWLSGLVWAFLGVLLLSWLIR